MTDGDRAPGQLRTRVVIAGKMPPPIGGQNINTKRVFDLLAAEPDLAVDHLDMAFTTDWSDSRRAAPRKVIELGRVIGRAFRIRRRGRIDLLLYPAGGPHTVPIVRDLILLPLLRMLTANIVLHVRAAGLARRLASSGMLTRRICRLVYGTCCRHAVVLSEFGRADADAVGISMTHVIPNAFEDIAGGVRSHTPSTVARVLSVGHLCADKGTPALIAAFAAATADDPTAELTLVGEPLTPYSEQQLTADIEASGAHDRIRWTGPLLGEDLDAAYRGADLAVFASVAPYESFGMVMIEAMQWGLPLVVTDWRANLEVCGPAFGGVVASDPKDDLTTSLRVALETALGDRTTWQAWGQHNREIYEQRFTMTVLRRRLLRLVAEVSGATAVVEPHRPDPRDTESSVS